MLFLPLPIYCFACSFKRKSPSKEQDKPFFLPPLKPMFHLSVHSSSFFLFPLLSLLLSLCPSSSATMLYGWLLRSLSYSPFVSSTVCVSHGGWWCGDIRPTRPKFHLKPCNNCSKKHFSFQFTHIFFMVPYSSDVLLLCIIIR